MVQHNLTDKELIEVAEKEKVSVEFLKRSLDEGTIIAARNNKRTFEPVVIGTGVTTKVNSNIGTSPTNINLEDEIRKLEVSIEAGADTVMDLSTGGDVYAIREELISRSPIPFGTVPIYEAVALETGNGDKHIAQAINRLTKDLLFEMVERQAEQGVDYMTIHSGVTAKGVEILDKSQRVTGIVSRGGGIHANMIRRKREENPFYEYFDELIQLAKKHNFTLSLGDGCRPGSIADASDAFQLYELQILGELTKRCRDAGVPCWIEGPGHVPLNQIEMNVKLEKRLCYNAPFYILGMLPTDCGAGYDHIVGAIGGAVAAAAGADYLCYLTPAEHLGLPTVEDVRDGVVAFKIAAHIGDIAKGIPGAFERDLQMSIARHKFDWAKMIELSIYPKGARAILDRYDYDESQGCAMCGDYCPMSDAIQTGTALTGKKLAKEQYVDTKG